MTYLDHDLGPEGPSRAPAAPVVTQRTAAAPPMLDLQRLAGNAAVSQAVKSGQFDSTPVQRLEGATAEDEKDEMEEQEMEEGAEESAEEDESQDLATDLEEEKAEEEQEMEEGAEKSAEEDEAEDLATDLEEEKAEEEQEEDEAESAG